MVMLLLQTVMMKFPFRVVHPVLLWFRVKVMMRFVFRALRFLVPPPLLVPSFALPCRPVADALLDVVKFDFLILLLPSCLHNPLFSTPILRPKASAHGSSRFLLTLLLEAQSVFEPLCAQHTRGLQHKGNKGLTETVE
jgi:hypothetical protein